MCRFLLTSLNIEAILGEITIAQRRKKLEEMARGNGLSDAYTATLTRLKAQKGNRAGLGLQALMWVVYSKRPLRADELCHALGVEIGSAELDPENIPPLGALLASCLGLLTVEAFSSRVRLVHFTLQEHLSSDPTLFLSSHSTIAEVCLTYLNFGSVRDHLSNCGLTSSTMPLLDYAPYYWWWHAKRGMTEKIKTFPLEFLAVLTPRMYDKVVQSSSSQSGGVYPDFSAIGRLTGSQRPDIEVFIEIMNRAAPMTEAKSEGPKIAGMETRALSEAIMVGRNEEVKMLLERGDFNPNHGFTELGFTPLIYATTFSREEIVKMLLEREDINPDHRNVWDGSTALCVAAAIGHEGIVKMFLEREDVNPHHVDNDGQTPLWLAADNGHEGVVKMLLELEGVSIDQPDTKNGQAPLSRAAENGHEGVVKLLLEQADVNPNQPDTKYGQTPLSLAAKGGHEGIVKSLLERSNVSPTMPDNKNQTPLSLALSEGHDTVARILMEHENPDSDKAGHGRHTSLPPPDGPEDEFVVDTQSRSRDPNTDITEFNGQLQPPPGVFYERGRLSDLQGSTSEPADQSRPTQLPWWSRILCTRPRKLFRRRRNTKTRINNP